MRIGFNLKATIHALGTRRLFGALWVHILALACAVSFGGGACADEAIFPKPDMEGTVEVSLPAKAKTLILLLSGDGGWWGDLDAQVAKRLSDKGYAVVGVDTSVWFDDDRARPEIEAHMERLMRSYAARTGASHFILAGYSFGADIVPLVYNDLSPVRRAQVTGLVLIAPERLAATQVTIGERTGLDKGDIDLAPELAKLPVDRTVCIYGADEADDSGCTLEALRGATRVSLPGGHHFDNDAERLTAAILSGLQKRSGLWRGTRHRP